MENGTGRGYLKLQEKKKEKVKSTLRTLGFG